MNVCSSQMMTTANGKGKILYLCGCHAVLDSVLDLSKHRIKVRMSNPQVENFCRELYNSKPAGKVGVLNG